MKGNIQQNKTKTMRRVGLFYALTNSFKLQFNTKNGWIHMAACAFYVMWYHITCRLWKVPLYTHERMKFRKEKFFKKNLLVWLWESFWPMFIAFFWVYCLPPHWGSEPKEGMIFSGGGVEKSILHGDHSTQDTEIQLSRSWHSRVDSMLVLSILYPWNRFCQAQWWSWGRNNGYTTPARADLPGIPWQSRG